MLHRTTFRQQEEKSWSANNSNDQQEFIPSRIRHFFNVTNRVENQNTQKE